VIEIIALHALWGTSIPMSKQLLTYASPFLLTPIRLIVAGIVLLLVNLVRNQKTWITSPRFWLYNSQVIIAVYAKYMLRYWGLDHMPASKLAFLLSLAPFVTAFFSFIVFKERLSKKQWLGLLIGFCGMIPIIITSSPSEQVVGEFFYISWAELAVFAAVCINSYAMIFSRILIRDHGQSVILSNSVRMLGAGILAAFTLCFVDVPLTITEVGPFVGWLSLLIVTSNVICHNFHLYLYKFYTPTFLSFTDFLSLLFTALYSVIFLHEAFTWHYAASAAIIFAGLYIFYQDELKMIYIKPV
jgi:drug/metabolite transporter (DMT)-like permease